MAITKEKGSLVGRLLSADSHVIESPDVWKGILPENFWGSPKADRSGPGMDPALRTSEMEVDGVVAEVLYPTLGLKVLSIEDAETQEAACHAYNEWLARYCSAAPDRLVGIGMIPTYRSDRAVTEINWCKEAGFRGILVWQVPHPDLPFRSRHYDPIWEAAARLKLPVSLHILSGFEYEVPRSSLSTIEIVTALRNPIKTVSPQENMLALDLVQRTVNLKLLAAMDSTAEMIFSGVFERFPQLKTVIVENEIGWLPFALTQWDFYFKKEHMDFSTLPFKRLPSEYAKSNLYATFFLDVLSENIFQNWGSDNFMWSNDYPHANTSWPNSQEFVDHQLEHLSGEVLHKVLRGNAEKLYGFPSTK